jgi:cell division protein FtsN
MGRDSGNNSSAPRKGGNSLWSGIFVGMLVGVCMAVGVAWYLMKAPSPFTNKEQPAAAKSQPDSSKPAATAAPGTATEKSAAAPGDGKPRFEFYKVLTDKEKATIDVPSKPVEKPKPIVNLQQQSSKTASAYEPQILQAGSFSNVNDAEKLKAKLAMLGVEANIQTATIPDKGVWYRVRLGPYKSAADLNRASSYLKQNGVDSTPMHAQ